MTAPAFKEVTKDEFKAIYFRLGGRSSGWTGDYWQEFFERKLEPGWKFMVQEPSSPDHDCMWIVTDPDTGEYRLFFMTEESTERFFDDPGKCHG